MSDLQHRAEHVGGVIEALQALPQGLGAGLAVALAPEEAAELGDDIDTAIAQASMRDGVLTVRLPKHEQYRRRKIDIQSA